MKKSPQKTTQKESKDNSSKVSGIYTFSCILYFIQLFFLYKGIYNRPILQSISTFILTSILFYLLINIRKIISFTFKIAFKSIGIYMALFISIGSTLMGISNQIYLSNQELVTSKCKIISVTEGSARISSCIQIELNHKQVNLINDYFGKYVRELKKSKRTLEESYIELTYKNGLFGMIKVEDAYVVINK